MSSSRAGGCACRSTADASWRRSVCDDRIWVELAHVIQAAAGNDGALIGSFGAKGGSNSPRRSSCWFEGDRSEPEWPSRVNAPVLRAELGTASIGISSISTLKPCINAETSPVQAPMCQTLVPLAFLLSTIAIACTESVLTLSQTGQQRRSPGGDGNLTCL